MSFRPPLRVSVTRHEEKERKLKDFLAHHITGTQTGSGATPNTHLLIVARSLTSPIVMAITGLSQEIARAGLAVRLILAQLDAAPSPEDWGRSIAFGFEIRWAKHPRLIEAHEQLVIGPHTCWIGDCMRRDPAKCDAYESFVEDCGEAAGCATVSFERLWGASQQLADSRSREGALAAPGPMPPVEAASQATVGTRH